MSNKKLIILIISIILLLSIIIILRFLKMGDTNTDIERLQVRLGEKFTLIEECNNKYILDYRQYDLNNDNVVDDILLIGDKERVNDNFSQSMLIVVRDCKNGKIYRYDLSELSGYRAHIELYNLLNNDIPQIILTTDTGEKNKEKQYIILKYNKGKFQEIFGLDRNKGVEIIGKYKDNYVIEVFVKNMNKTFSLDIKDKKSFYLKNRIYDENRKLINQDVSAVSKNIDCLEQYIFDDNTKGILTKQKVIGINKTDILDDITTIWRFEKDKLIIFSIEGQRCGKIL